MVATTKGMGIEEVVTAPRSPWQNPYVERLIGSIRRGCLDHIIVWNERSLCRILHSYFHYYERSRTHLALAKDAPVPGAVDQPEKAVSRLFPRLEDCIIAISGAPLSLVNVAAGVQEHSPSSVF